jgi:L-seryl-tRNA(Ser) seleniumtransferase
METPCARALVGEFSRDAVLRAVRGGLEDVRKRLLDGDGAGALPFGIEPFFDDVRARLGRERQRSLRRVINATGIVVHTNLGRAPLAAAALEAVAEVAAGYSNLELDLASGGRGSRYRAVDGLLCRVTGAEAALAVNNNAAAVLLALGALARGGEVVVSRGELVEIGGSFRMPDIIAQSGARLVEVGTTNRTRPADYERAITAETRVLLKVHPSNYRVVGFTATVTTGELAALGRAHGLPVMEDLGSGALVDLRRYGLPHEPTAREVLAAGADVVTFSGDKLLGGPQAGMVLGRREIVERLKGHPLLRAVRIDRLSLAALEATLRLYLDEGRLAESLPVLRMLAQGARELEARAERLRASLERLGGLDVRLDEGIGYAGGGSLPEEGIPSRLVTVRAAGLGADALARRLRAHRPAVVGRIAAGRFVMDVRTLADGDVMDVAAAFRAMLAP